MIRWTALICKSAKGNCIRAEWMGEWTRRLRILSAICGVDACGLVGSQSEADLNPIRTQSERRWEDGLSGWWREGLGVLTRRGNWVCRAFSRFFAAMTLRVWAQVSCQRDGWRLMRRIAGDLLARTLFRINMDSETGTPRPYNNSLFPG